VTDPLNSTSPAARPNHVWVYGTDHSPWVQSVLLGLHQKQIAHTLVTVPPLRLFLRSGILMPAARFDDGTWLYDSEKILVELGFSEVPEDVRATLWRVFLSGAMRRIDDPWKFWHAFSYVRDGHPFLPRRLWNHFWRSFSVFYFFTTITLGRRGRARPTPEQLTGLFSSLQERLAPGAEFLGGTEPGTADLQLFGLVQMFATIPGLSFEVLQEEPSLQPLREWCARIQQRAADYTHLYSARDFEPKGPDVQPAPLLDRLSYWSGAALMWLALPITFPTVMHFVRRVQKQRQQPTHPSSVGSMTKKG